MARVRIHLVTYRRHPLLARALQSLRAQTFTDWICEVHNDAPDDPYPGELVRQAGDSRLRYVPHEKNLGPTATFNLLYTPVSEPYLSLLEDDNWWEPEFLATMVAALELHPTVELAWANMRLWREESDGSWTDLGRDIWETSSESPRLFHFPQLLQINDALHSNGAMLVRNREPERHRLPPTALFDAVESLRERTFAHPLLFVPRRLANFALTRQTSRSSDGQRWAETQFLLAASFLHCVPVTDTGLAQLWNERRRQRPRSTTLLFQVALGGVRPFRLLRHARAADWLDFFRALLVHPLSSWRILRARQRHAEIWEFLLTHTQARVAEAHTVGFCRADESTLVRKRSVP
jgi:hypothetical protein